MKIQDDELQEATPGELKSVVRFFLTVVGLLFLFVTSILFIIFKLTIG